MPPIHYWGNSSSISNQFLAYSDVISPFEEFSFEVIEPNSSTNHILFEVYNVTVAKNSKF